MKTALRWLLGSSLALNAGVALLAYGWVFHPQVTQRLRQKLRVASPAVAAMKSQRHDLFTQVADCEKPGSVVFAGDSLTEYGLWNEWVRPPAINRGIATETSADLLRRTEPIAQLKASQVFVMIGRNDMGRVSAESTVANILSIVRLLKSARPEREVIVQSILPALEGPEGLRAVASLNATLQHRAEEGGYTYLDVSRAFYDANGRVRPHLFIDGLHLSAAGYREWLLALPAELRCDGGAADP